MSASDRYDRPRPHWGKRIGFGIFVILVILVVAAIVLYTGMQNYKPLEGEAFAKVCFTEPEAYTLEGHISFYDNDGHLSPVQNFPVSGEKVQLHGNIIKFSFPLKAFPNGYKLINADGYYTTSNNKNPYTSTSHPFNSEDWWFNMVRNPLFSWFINASDDSIHLPSPSTIYTLSIQENGHLKAVAVPGPNCRGLTS